MTATPSSLTLTQGGSQNATVSIAAINGFASQVTVSATGLPSGVSATPSGFSMPPGVTQTVTLTASASATPGTFSLSLQAVSGSLTHAVSVTGSIAAAPPGLPFSSTRARYVRTNAFYDPNSLEFAPPHFVAYDAPHRQFFVSNPYLNEIDVFDAVREVQTSAIPVPYAWGIDISPIDGTLYAGTLLGDIYKINTATLSVSIRYPSSSIGPNGWSASTALVLSDGRLALQGGAGGILGIDGFGGVAVWNPVTNALDAGTALDLTLPSSTSVCPNVGNSGAFALSGDRTRILLTWVDEGGGGDPICSYDPVAKIATYGNFPFGTFVRQIIPTPDGKRFFLTSNLDGVGVFDAHTVQMIGQITGPNPYSGIPNAASGAVISLDGKTLYLLDQGSQAVGAYDTTTLAQTGWVPSFLVDDAERGVVINAIDETGLMLGYTGHGVGFLDASQLKANPLSTFNPGYATTNTGPVTGGTPTGTIGSSLLAGSATLSSVYLGGVAAAGVLPSGTSLSLVTPPAATPGPVNITTLYSDGGVGIVPDGFSYGPTILEVTPNGATAEGGQLGALIGYGFGSTASGVQVTIGGQPAPVTVLHTSAPLSPYPFPAEGLQFKIPPGIAGTAVDVTVTTASGSTTAKSAFHYTPAVQSFPTSANLQAGLYDPHRDLYYFTDTSSIQVLSRTSGKWLTPIALPGTIAKSRLLAVSESPDGTKLAVSDFGGQAIFVLNPDNSASVQRFPMPIDYLNQSLVAPTGLAIANTGAVYFVAPDIGGTGTPAFYKLLTSTGVITNYTYFISNSKYDRVLLSPDGSRVYASPSGGSVWVDTATDKIHASASTGSNAGGLPDLAISGDGSTVDIDGFNADASLNALSTSAYVDWETWFPEGVIGQKLNQDGSILFQPLTDGIDLLARNSGRLLYRIQVPGTLADVYDALAVANGTNTLAVITTTGVSFVDLSGLTIPAADARPFLHASSGNLASEDAGTETRPQPASARPSTQPSAHPALKRKNHPASAPRSW